MAALTNYLADGLVDAAFRGVAFSPLTNVYLALYTVAPTAEGGGTEVTGGSYSRKLCLMSDGDNPGEVKNTNAINFTAMPACTVVATAILSTSSGGNMLVYNTLISPRTIVEGETLTADAGAIVVALT